MLSSKDNPLIKKVISLKKKKGRTKHQLFIAEGPHLIQEAFKSSFNIRALIISEPIIEKETEGESFKSEIYAFIQEAETRGISIYYVTRQIFKELAETENPQGILALISIPERNLPERQIQTYPQKQGFLGLIINEVQDPGNMGTILRTAWGAGISDIFITPGSVDPYAGKVVRASQGGVFNLTIYRRILVEIINWAHKRGITIVSGDPRGTKIYYEYDFASPTLILLGNEARGPQFVADSISIKIPLPGGAESLNVATASGILMFEAIRQRSK